MLSCTRRVKPRESGHAFGVECYGLSDFWPDRDGSYWPSGIPQPSYGAAAEGSDRHNHKPFPWNGARRQAGPDRRTTRRRRITLSTGYGGGWLTFESLDEAPAHPDPLGLGPVSVSRAASTVQARRVAKGMSHRHPADALPWQTKPGCWGNIHFVRKFAYSLCGELYERWPLLRIRSRLSLRAVLPHQTALQPAVCDLGPLSRCEEDAGAATFYRRDGVVANDHNPRLPTAACARRSSNRPGH